MKYIKKLAKKYQLEKLNNPKHLKTISISTILVILLICILITSSYIVMLWLVPDLKHTLTFGLFK